MKTLIISDLHLGNGGPYDVFEGRETLPALLDHLGEKPLRVLVNGDGVDFLMNEDPLEGAKRELLEETGLVAAKWTKIARVHLSNSVGDEEGFLYVAEGLTQVQAQPEDTEQLHVRRILLTEAIEMVMRSEITDSLSVMGLLKVARLRGI